MRAAYRAWNSMVGSFYSIKDKKILTG